MTKAAELAKMGEVLTNSQIGGRRNIVINGAMQVDQRNSGSSVTPADTDYTVDRWRYTASQASKFTFQQNTGSTPPAGFKNYMGFTVASAVTVGNADYFAITQRIEGNNVSQLELGTANAKTVTLSFLVRSSLTGTFGGALRGASFGRSYPFTYSISSANTWESKTITIAGDTSGTYQTDNTTGLEVIFGLGVGSDNSGSAGAWTGSWVANIRHGALPPSSTRKPASRQPSRIYGDASGDTAGASRGGARPSGATGEPASD